MFALAHSALIGPALLAVALPALASLSGCGASDLPRPRYVRQETAALTQVGYPAPPARVEFIPKQPRDGAVWLDGEWSWSGSKWAWTPGRWVMAPVGSRFSPWTTIRDERGTVYFASGVWKDASGHPIDAPAPLALAHSTAGDVTSQEGDSEKTGPRTHPERAPGATGSAPEARTTAGAHP